VKQDEHEHQKALIEWASIASYQHHCLRLLYAIPNGGARDVRVGKKLKAEGVKRGVPDLCLPVPCGVYHGMYIEMKTEVGRATPEQKQWIQDLNEQGYYAVIAKGWEQAKNEILGYLALKSQKTVKTP